MIFLAQHLPGLLLLASAALYFLPLAGHGGYSEAASAAIGVLTVGLVYTFGRHWKNERAGLLAGSCLATSFGYFILTQFGSGDMAFTFWMTLALFAMSRLLTVRLPEQVRRYTGILVVAIAGGVIVRGAMALIPLPVLMMTLSYTGMQAQMRKIPWQPILLVIVLTVLSPFWGWGAEVTRTAPFYVYIPVLAIGFLPWTVFLPKIIGAAFAHQGIAMKRDPTMALLVFWSFFSAAFQSFWPAKSVGIILPVFPALALLVGHALDDIMEEAGWPKWVEQGLVSFLVILVGLLVLLKWPGAAIQFRHPIALAALAHSGILSLVLGISIFVLVGVWGMRQAMPCLAMMMIVQVVLLGTLASLGFGIHPDWNRRGWAPVQYRSSK